MSLTPHQLESRLSTSALALRGYDQKNLGRTPELLAHPVYGPIVRQHLEEASRICSKVTGHRVNLVTRVRRRRETTLKTYHEAVSLIISMELAQLRLLREFFDIDYHDAKMAYGFSLGEIAAVVAGGVIEMSEALRIPLSLAPDCAELARGVTLGVLFSRDEPLPLDEVRRLCVRMNKQGDGVMGISAHLTPNSLLVLGQGDTLDRFARKMHDVLPKSTRLRKNKGRWPRLHTPILWERAVSNRACFMLNTLENGMVAPRPPVFSLVTGGLSYNDYNAGDILCKWTDHPQLLWKAIEETFSSGIKTVIHVGPAPNLIPATFRRIAANVETQVHGRVGGKALTNVVCHRWLRSLLPRKSSLLCAPQVDHVILEDWLLEQPHSHCQHKGRHKRLASADHDAEHRPVALHRAQIAPQRRLVALVFIRLRHHNSLAHNVQSF